MKKSIIIQGLKVQVELLACIVQFSCQQDKPDAKKYLKAVQRFADIVIEQGKNRYGEKYTTLFVDGLDTAFLKPALLNGKGIQDRIMGIKESIHDEIKFFIPLLF